MPIRVSSSIIRKRPSRSAIVATVITGRYGGAAGPTASFADSTVTPCDCAARFIVGQAIACCSGESGSYRPASCEPGAAASEKGRHEACLSGARGRYYLALVSAAAPVAGAFFTPEFADDVLLLIALSSLATVFFFALCFACFVFFDMLS